MGVRVLRDEEQMAFDLTNQLGEANRAKFVIADQAPNDIRGAAEPQPPQDEAVGMSYKEMSAGPQRMLKNIVETYCNNMPEEVAAERLKMIEEAGWEKVKFAWAGAMKPGVGHYYRIQGPTFVIEFCNVQNDAEGNPANHIHAVWRDMTGDFNLPIK